MKDKVILITGASSGIGKALALRYAKAGAKIAAAARDHQRLIEVQDEIRKAGGECHIIQADVSRREDCERMVQEAVHTFGRLDVLINNAGISMRALFNDLKLEVIEQLMQVNFWGTVYSTKYALPHLLQSKGSIIGVSSIAGYRGLPARTGYSASKFAMQGFLESLRTELLHSGVHVMVACPGFTGTNIRNTALTAEGKAQGDSPLDEGKIMSAEEVADRIYWGNVKRKRTLIMTTQGKFTVFLNKLFPGWMDKMVFRHFQKESDSPLK